jgi:thymidine phosphorylase
MQSKDGYLNSVDTYEIGMAALELGAGRKTNG